MYKISDYFFESFYSKQMYHDVLKSSKKNILLYFLLLSAILAVPMNIRFGISVAESVKKELPYYLEQLPELRIRGGRLTTLTNDRVVINIKDTNQPFCIIDPSIGFSGLPDSVGASMYLFNDCMVMYKATGEGKIIKFNKGKSFLINKEKINRWSKWYPLFVVIFYILFVLWGLIVSSISALINSFIGFIVAKVNNISFSFYELFSMSLLIATPGMVLKTILDFIFRGKIHIWYIYAAISIVYMVLAIDSYILLERENEQKKITEEV